MSIITRISLALSEEEKRNKDHGELNSTKKTKNFSFSSINLSMTQHRLSNGVSPAKSTTVNSTPCPFLITDCDDEDSSPNTPVVASGGSSTGETPTKRRFGYSRQEKSLGTLTRRFMSLLRQSKTGVMDLKHVS